ncbi:hypothetical protein OQA88_1102 [Cercophora sp. LCS_1]
MVKFASLLVALAASVTALPSTGRTLSARQDECDAVRTYLAGPGAIFGCTEMPSPPYEECTWCCDEIWDMEIYDMGWGGDPPCHEDHEENLCPNGYKGWHCADHGH